MLAYSILLGLCASVATAQISTQHQAAFDIPQDQVPLGGQYRLKDAVTPEVEKLIHDLMNNGTIPGFSLGVVHPDGHVELRAFGRRTEDGDEVTTDTRFVIASCSKNFLASTLGVLMDDFANGRNVTALPQTMDGKKFDWLTKVKDLLPGDWELMDEWASEKASIRDILSHQSGLPRHDFSYRPDDKPIDVIRRMRHLRPAFELRQRYSYNNQMYMLGSYLVTKYSGMPYTEFITKRIWDPLGMSATTFSQAEAGKSGLLTQPWVRFGRRIPFWFPDEMIELNAGPGGIISNVVDLTKWIKMLLNKGVDPVTNTTILPYSVVDAVTSAHALTSPRTQHPDLSISGYGHGWGRYSYQGHEIITHAGGIPGFSAELVWMPADNVGVAVLANADDKNDQQLAVAFRILEDQLGLERLASVRYASIKNSRDAASDKPPTSPVEVDAVDVTKEVPIAKYEGTYVNVGYPNITICATTSSAPACRDVLATFAQFDDLSLENNTLYAHFLVAWTSHARVRRIRGNTFAITLTNLFPHGYGKDTSPFETAETGESDARVEFVVDGTSGESESEIVGFGILDMVGELTERQRLGGSIEETADVWFERV